MKPLNEKEINRTFLHFLFQFSQVIVLVVLCVYLFLLTYRFQTELLTQQKQQYDQVFFRYGLMAEKADSLQQYMHLLNTTQVTNDLQVQRLISQKKEGILKLLSHQADSLRYFLVYQKVVGHVNEVLMLKDSLRKATAEEQMLRNDLTQCLSNSRRPARSVNRSTGTFN